MKRSDDRILTTHAGSLPRPPDLTALYARRARGEAVDNTRVAQEGRVAVTASLAKQIASGLDIVNEGEQQRESFVLYLRHRLAGLGGSGERKMQADIDRYPEFKKDLQEKASAARESVSNRDFIPKAIGEIRYLDRRAVEEECSTFKDLVDGRRRDIAEAFVTAPSPGIVAAIVQNEHYDTEERYLHALGEALRIEYEAIAGHGFVLQLDCPDLALERHCSYRDRSLSDFIAFCERVIETINRAIANIPAEQVRLHVCWGNYEGPHDCDVPLSDILPVIKQAKVGALVLPFANPRHQHEFRVLERIPLAEGQILIGGVIDTLTNFVEHPEVVADRVEQLANAMGDPKRVIAGTDCGFDTAAGMGRVSEDVVWAKLRALTEGARIATTRLF